MPIVDNAVIMAAGTSSRCAPLSYEMPKALITVKGEVLIERQIRQLQEAGVPSAYFDPVADVDEVTDLGHAISCMKAIREASQEQLLAIPGMTKAAAEAVLKWAEATKK